jgi:hypothetical protein
MDKSPLILNRYGEPNKFDHCPEGTICKVMMGANGEYVLYKQISPDEENPVWELQESPKHAIR